MLITITISRKRLDELHSLRTAAGLYAVSDGVLAQILISAGLEAEIADLKRLAEPEAA